MRVHAIALIPITVLRRYRRIIGVAAMSSGAMLLGLVLVRCLLVVLSRRRSKVVEPVVVVQQRLFDVPYAVLGADGELEVFFRYRVPVFNLYEFLKHCAMRKFAHIYRPS